MASYVQGISRIEIAFSFGKTRNWILISFEFPLYQICIYKLKSVIPLSARHFPLSYPNKIGVHHSGLGEFTFFSFPPVLRGFLPLFPLCEDDFLPPLKIDGVAF